MAIALAARWVLASLAYSVAFDTLQVQMSHDTNDFQVYWSDLRHPCEEKIFARLHNIADI